MLVDKIEVKFCLFDRDDLAEPPFKWHVYVTGHSLGGALATLLALELSSSQLAKWVLYLSTYEVFFILQYITLNMHVCVFTCKNLGRKD